MKNPAAGGGRWVDVPPERLVSWIVTFAQRHGAESVSRDEAGVTITFSAADGAAAEMEQHLRRLHFMWRLSRTPEPGGIAV